MVAKLIREVAQLELPRATKPPLPDGLDRIMTFDCIDMKSLIALSIGEKVTMSLLSFLNVGVKIAKEFGGV